VAATRAAWAARAAARAWVARRNAMVAAHASGVAWAAVTEYEDLIRRNAPAQFPAVTTAPRTLPW